MIDLDARRYLGGREIAFSHRALLEAILPIVDDTLRMEERSGIRSNAGLNIFSDAFQRSKDQIGSEAEEAFHAYVSYIDRNTRNAVSDRTKFDDRKVTTKASFGFVRLGDGN